jgi:hydroxymethylpyrimidine/phosphomethylpyrimidine kinase
MNKPPVVWSIAGFDPSCGAGVTADVKTIGAFGCYGVACVTALTVQNTVGVRRVQPVSPVVVRETLEALLEDLPPAAIKIGMLATGNSAATVAEFISKLPRGACPIVLDPILRSSSGAELLDRDGVQMLLARLLPLCTVVTPNRQEAAALSGLSAADVEGCGRALRRLGAAAVVITGGDILASEQNTAGSADDVLVYARRGMELVETLSAPRIASTSTHGTGCAFSTAIACTLARGEAVPAAITAAKSFVISAIKRSPGLGQGRGPLALSAT